MAARLALLTVLVLCTVATVVSADNFFYASSTGYCEKQCDEATWFRFFSCNSDTKCEYRIQPWIASIFVTLILSIVFAIIGGVVRCICCCR